MRRISITFVLALLVAVTAMKAQLPTYNLSVENQRVVGNELRFDIYMENTSIQDIYLGECDFVLDFNHQYFTDPSFKIEPVNNNLTTKNYGFDAVLLPTSQLALALNSPVMDLSGAVSQEKFATDVQQIAADGQKMLIARGVVQGITDPNGTAGLRWVADGKFSTKVSSYMNYHPWKLEFISTGAKYVNPADMPLSTVTAAPEPVAGENQSSISVFPNPAKADFTIKTSVSGDVQVKVFSVTGTEILSVKGTTVNGDLKISLPAEVASGNYVVRVQDTRDNKVIGSSSLVVAK